MSDISSQKHLQSSVARTSLDITGMNDISCGLDFALLIVAGKWKLAIVSCLLSGPCRFGDLKRRVAGISGGVLTRQLRELAATDVLIRHDHRHSIPRVDYTLTPFGITLAEAIRPLCEWGLENRAQIEGMALSGRSEKNHRAR